MPTGERAGGTGRPRALVFSLRRSSRLFRVVAHHGRLREYPQMHAVPPADGRRERPLQNALLSRRRCRGSPSTPSALDEADLEGVRWSSVMRATALNQGKSSTSLPNRSARDAVLLVEAAHRSSPRALLSPRCQYMRLARLNALLSAYK